MKPMPMPVAPVAWVMVLFFEPHPVAVHQEDAHRIVFIVVVQHLIGQGIHEVQRVTSTPRIVAGDQIVPGVPDHGIPGVANDIVGDLVVEAVPEPDRIPTHTQFDRFRGDPIAFDDVVLRLLQIHAKQGIGDQIVLDDIEIAPHLDSRIQVVVGIPGVGQMQVHQGGAIRPQHDDRALAAPIDGHLTLPIDGQRALDGHRSGIDARWRDQPAPGIGGIHQFLKQGIIRRRSPSAATAAAATIQRDPVRQPA